LKTYANDFSGKNQSTPKTADGATDDGHETQNHYETHLEELHLGLQSNVHSLSIVVLFLIVLIVLEGNIGEVGRPNVETNE
jgi:hypothetical protein